MDYYFMKGGETMETLFPVYYNEKDYYITNSGKIFDFNSKEEISNNFSLTERAKLVAVAWIGNIDLPINYKDGNSNNISRSNIEYKLPDIQSNSDSTIMIGNEIFYEVIGYKYYYVSKTGLIYSTIYNKLLHKKISRYPHYVRISLVDNDGKRRMRQFHRIVWYSISKNPEDPDMDINHKDGRPWNNVYSNLEETSSLENVRYSMFILKSRNTTWTEHEIHLICKYLSNGLSIKDVYENFWIRAKINYDGFKILAHHLLYHTKFWVDISSQYDFSKWKKANSLYSDDQVKLICEYLEKGYRPFEIEKMTNIPLKYISSVKNRVSRKDISKDYNF